MNTAQMASEATPIIDFAAAVDAREAKAVPLDAHPDAALIRSCLEYASRMNGLASLYIVDPCDGEFAAPVDDAARLVADKALRRVTREEPATLDGLCAKAMLIFTMLGVQDPTASLESMDLDFLRSVAGDVKRFQRAAQATQQSDVPIAVPA